jgi:hypothetical protein
MISPHFVEKLAKASFILRNFFTDARFHHVVAQALLESFKSFGGGLHYSFIIQRPVVVLQYS